MARRSEAPVSSRIGPTCADPPTTVSRRGSSRARSVDCTITGMPAQSRWPAHKRSPRTMPGSSRPPDSRTLDVRWRCPPIADVAGCPPQPRRRGGSVACNVVVSGCEGGLALTDHHRPGSPDRRRWPARWRARARTPARAGVREGSFVRPRRLLPLTHVDWFDLGGARNPVDPVRLGNLSPPGPPLNERVVEAHSLPPRGRGEREQRDEHHHVDDAPVPMSVVPDT